MFAAQIHAQEVDEGDVLLDSDSAEDTMEAENTQDAITPESLTVHFGPFDAAHLSKTTMETTSPRDKAMVWIVQD